MGLLRSFVVAVLVIFCPQISHSRNIIQNAFAIVSHAANLPSVPTNSTSVAVNPHGSASCDVWEDTNIPGLDLNVATYMDDRQDSWEECRDLCNIRPSCNFFEWHTRYGDCWMKTGVSKKVTRKGIVSGSHCRQGSPLSYKISSSGGAKAKYPKLLGIYKLTGDTHNSFPTYKHENGKNYLYVNDAPYDNWVVSTSSAYGNSASLYANKTSNGSGPPAGGWKYSDNGWHWDPTLRVLQYNQQGFNEGCEEEGCGEGEYVEGVSLPTSSSCEINNRTKKCAGGCFHGSATVLLESGQAKKMNELIIGDKIQTSSEGFSPFIGWLDWMPDTETIFLTLHTERSSITLTPTHLVFVKSGDISITKYARDVSILDQLINKDGKPEVVSRITKSVATGYYSPLTEPGTLVVDGFYASCFASFPHELAQMVLFPVRTWPSVFLGTDGGPGTYIKLVKTLGTFLNIRDAALPGLFFWDYSKQEF